MTTKNNKDLQKKLRIISNGTKIILKGQGGDGVKMLGQVLGNYLTTLEYKVSLIFSYDSAMRGGDISAFLIFSHDKIENPFIKKADLTLDFSKLPIKRMALNDLNDKKAGNMILFGALIKNLKLDFKKEEIHKVLPKKSVEPNFKAIEFGYKNSDKII